MSGAARSFPGKNANETTVVFFPTTGDFAIDGCTSPQIRNHTLLPPAPLSGSSNKVPFVIELLPIGVPEQLDITQVVLRQDGNTMLVLNNDRWLSPPQKKCIQPFHPR
ncbi:hypothetical protein DMB90_10285 [Raoultella planticola]|uniref:ABC-type transport auxiliary lipoprotein component domain-containing protein n=1 Tax=Raoultella planticola TaxID=575 RepID=A0A5P6A9N9_RAOPL|nr:hypothetical protein DMB90_10285 [Raoultella planticola]